ncbi:hypothetical protein I6M59_02110 [Shewanella algae]|nr:hypothetical protein [Shewanella algae]
MEQVWQWLRQHCLSNRVFDCTSKLLTKYPEPGIPSLRIPVGLNLCASETG